MDPQKGRYTLDGVAPKMLRTQHSPVQCRRPLGPPPRGPTGGHQELQAQHAAAQRRNPVHRRQRDLPPPGVAAPARASPACCLDGLLTPSPAAHRPQRFHRFGNDGRQGRPGAYLGVRRGPGLCRLPTLARILRHTRRKVPNNHTFLGMAEPQKGGRDSCGPAGTPRLKPWHLLISNPK